MVDQLGRVKDFIVAHRHGLPAADVYVDVLPAGDIWVVCRTCGDSLLASRNTTVKKGKGE